MIAVSRPLTARGSLAGRVISATRYFAARPPTPSGFQGCAFAAESPERAEESREEGRGAGSPPAAGPSRKPGSAASWSWEPRNLPNLPAPTRRGAHGRGPVRKRASRETFSRSRPRPGGRFPALDPQGCGLPAPSGRCRPSRASAPSVSGSRRPLPSLPHPGLRRPVPGPVPALWDTLPSFLPSSVPSLHLASQHWELGGGSRTGQPTPRAAPWSLRGPDLPPAPAARCSLACQSAAPATTAAAGDSVSKGSWRRLRPLLLLLLLRAGAGSASLGVGGADSPTGGAAAARTPSSWPSPPPSCPDARALTQFGRRTLALPHVGWQRGEVGSVEVPQRSGRFGHPPFPFPKFPKALEFKDSSVPSHPPFTTLHRAVLTPRKFPSRVNALPTLMPTVP